MQYVGGENLPEPLYKALTNDDYERGDANISVTGLIEPPQIRVLRERHTDELVVDVMSRYYSLLGTVAHKIIEGYEARHTVSEQRIFIEVAGWRISGKPDLWVSPNKLYDYKLSSVWSYIFPTKDTWIAQVNCYAYLYRTLGHPVEYGYVCLMMRDWTKSRVTGNYPDEPIKVVKVPLWEKIETERFLIDRVLLHQDCDERSADDLPECTDEECWLRLRRGQKPMYIRCEQYCEVAPWCYQRRNRK